MTKVSRSAGAPRARLTVFLLVALLALAGGGVNAQDRPIVPIIDLHHNTSSGLPASPYTIGTAVSVTGVVTVGVGIFTADYTDVYVQDPTGGIAIYNAAVLYNFAIGDSVTIDGTIAQYRGLTEVTLATYAVHETGHAVPAPLVVQCDDVEHAFLPDYSEPNEGRLVRLNNVTWSGAWPSFSGPITLHDDSGTCTLYIDGTTGCQSMTPPAGAFDVVGIVKQYAGYSPPYTGSYEFMPRSPDDFYILPGPQIIEGPRETNLQPDQVTIHFVTADATTASVEYGTTGTYELGVATDGLDQVAHDIVLSGLSAATIHHYRVTVTDETGQTTTPDKLCCTASAPGGTGVIRCIFNKSVDTSVATWGEATGGQDLVGWIVDRINATEATIDVAMYSFDLASVADALIAAKNRGVRVRFVYDNRYPYQTQVQRLVQNGIPVIDDAFGPNTGSEIMHHKLWIFDADAADPAQPWVYTGSWNLSNEGTYSDAQNVIFFQDQALARVCTVEFNEMWGSSVLIPNPDQSKFGTNKTDNTPKIFAIGGREVELYFAPSDPWIAAYIDEVEHADYSIHFCVMSYTRFDLCDELELRWLGVPGMEIRGVFDSSESGNESSQYHPMHGDGDYAWNPPADVWLDAETGTLHHKYMLIDVNRSGSDPVVMTGSANWSNAAVGDNDENVVLVHDAAITNCYFQEFAARYHAAGGTGYLAADVAEAPAARLRLRVGPNPVAGELRAVFALPARDEVVCDLYGPDGRRVERLLARELDPGTHTLRWVPGTASRPVASGAYFLRLQTSQGTISRRVTLVR